MSRPIIAITSSHNKEDKICMSPAYFDAVYKAGGVACFLPSFEHGKDNNVCICADLPSDIGRAEVFDRFGDDVSWRFTDRFENELLSCEISSYIENFDGFIFAGGVDVHPSFYGEKITSDKTEIDISRDLFEKELLKAAMNAGKPILGICRGLQLINVMLGGSLYQHIDGHMQTAPRTSNEFCVSVKEKTLLWKITGKSSIYVNSFHHQAVKSVAPGLNVCAVSEDDIVEGLCLDDYSFLLAVQWHPELIFKHDSSSFAIFCNFISAAEKYKK